MLRNLWGTGFSFSNSESFFTHKEVPERNKEIVKVIIFLWLASDNFSRTNRDTFYAHLLTRLAQVDSIQEVILVSNRGEVLFENKAGAAAKPDGETARWNEIIAGLDGSPAAELFFEKGCYYVHNIDIGHVIVGMTNAQSLERVKTACTQVKSKLADASVRKKVMLKMMTQRRCGVQT